MILCVNARPQMLDFKSQHIGVVFNIIDVVFSEMCLFHATPDHQLSRRKTKYTVQNMSFGDRNVPYEGKELPLSGNPRGGGGEGRRRPHDSSLWFRHCQECDSSNH